MRRSRVSNAGAPLAGEGGRVYVYAIARGKPGGIEGLRGIGDAPVEAVPVGDLHAVVSLHGDAVPEATEEALVRHDAVCSVAMRDGALAPLRFGAVFSDLARLRSEIASRGDEFQAILSRVEGHVELGVRVLRPRPPDPGAASSGAEYLRRRLDARRDALDLAAAVDERLDALAAARRARVLETPELVLSVSYLVATADVDRFRAAVDELDREWPDVTLACTGPWPPYSFVGGDE